jgi:ABC-type lipoprotein export system ATPase subunit
MIEVTGITKAFSTANGEVRAVDGADLSVGRGEFALILGRSGSGKSTLLAMLAGLVRPTAGTVRIRDREISSLTDDQMAELRAREIGFVFQFSGLIPTVTALENVLVPTLFWPEGPGSREKALALLEKVGVADRAGAFPATLSSGEMKRVAIARALINEPSILIADEPTGDLDVDTENEIMGLFRQLNSEGITIVMVTHNPDLIPCASHIYSMDRGKLKKNPYSTPPSCTAGTGPASGAPRDRP